jgi:type III pantothenate kinase
MNDCLIDSGNTRVKFAVRKQNSWQFLAAIDFEDPQFIEKCLHVLQNQTFSQIYLAIVSKGKRAERLEQFLLQTELPVIRIKSLARLGNLKIAYTEPKQLGVDRFLTMLAASEQALPCVLISFGTALTIDVLKANGEHLGGLIAPSPEFQWRSMQDHFPGLFNESGKVHSLANNTVDALSSGIALQTLSMLEHVISVNAKTRDSRVILCGGAAEQWVHKLSRECEYVPNLVFDGMHRYISLIHS